MMNKAFVLFGLLALSATAGDFPVFMTGSWRSTQADGSISEEHWTSAEGGVMIGMGRTVGKEGRLKSFEFLRIVLRDGRLELVPMPGGKPATTVFPLATVSSSRAVFENPAHDFPQRIIYWKNGSKLCARTEGMMNGKLEGEDWCWSPAKKK